MAVVQRSTTKCDPSTKWGWGHLPWDGGFSGPGRSESGLIWQGEAGPASLEDGVLRLAAGGGLSQEPVLQVFPLSPAAWRGGLPVAELA